MHVPLHCYCCRAQSAPVNITVNIIIADESFLARDHPDYPSKRPAYFPQLFRNFQPGDIETRNEVRFFGSRKGRREFFYSLAYLRSSSRPTLIPEILMAPSSRSNFNKLAAATPPSLSLSLSLSLSSPPSRGIDFRHFRLYPVSLENM